ncbi:hypothetical protein [Amycolatopsis magusensis]|uniref:hypothetical protein n=1 Tax=Amycolatopsis magusensis TaxID=882444 RepID=UPI0024A91482|nr:hypothetical protein [Amycolatopsis magusensis]MDI5976984.1 hypothetical protein [Amycolatopsis magusensis]
MLSKLTQLVAAALFALALAPAAASAAEADGVNDCANNYICWWNQDNYNGQRADGPHGADGCWNILNPHYAYSMTNNTNVNITMQSKTCGESGQQRAELSRQSTTSSTPFAVRSFLRCAVC